MFVETKLAVDNLVFIESTQNFTQMLRNVIIHHILYTITMFCDFSKEFYLKVSNSCDLFNDLIAATGREATHRS